MNINITPTELNAVLGSNNTPILLDVRENAEIEICSIAGHQQIRLSELPARYSELPTDRDIVVYCKVGGRSLEAAKFLLQQGFKSVKNLEGGILRWSDEIDPTMKKY